MITEFSIGLDLVVGFFTALYLGRLLFQKARSTFSEVQIASAAEKLSLLNQQVYKRA